MTSSVGVSEEVEICRARDLSDNAGQVRSGQAEIRVRNLYNQIE